MKKDDVQDSVDYQPKKSKRSKASPQLAPNRSSRRGKKKQSDEQFVPPQQIPRSDGDELLCFVSYECETSHVILQIPIVLCLGETFDLKQQSRIENDMIIIRVSKQSDNIICSMILSEEAMCNNKAITFNINGKYSWLTEKEILTKIIKSSRKSLNKNEWNQMFRFKIHDIKSDLFIVLTIRRQQEQNNEFAGLINQGNTCYMNSYLQMLYHLKEFRKMVFTCQTKEKDKFPATLQLLFSKMLKQKKAVSPQELIKSFGWSKKQVQIQQDAQQFSCLFFEALQKTLGYIDSKWGSVRQFFCGQIVHYIQCCNLGIVFEILTIGLRTDSNFMICNYLLQTPQHRLLMIMLDSKPQKEIMLIALNNMVSSQLVKVHFSNVGLKISYLPPILMIQLKRFQFNPYNQSNEKILDRFNYPQQISFSPWTLNPQKNEIYQLYSVLVHEGGQASSGHYYAYINIKNNWYRFNDETVTKVNRQKALDYNFGGQSSIVEYDLKQMKISTRQVQNKRTAYMLVYIKKQCKDQLLSKQIQQLSVPIWIDQYNKNKQNVQQQKKLRKQSICDVFIYNWNKYFLNKYSQGNGLSVKSQDDQKEDQDKLQMIAKNTKIEDWIQQLQSKMIDQLYVYVYWLSNDKEVVINAKARQCNFVHQLFKQTYDPSLIFFPIYAERQQFLIIVKQFYSNHEENSLKYIDCSKISKNSSYKNLYQHMQLHYKLIQKVNYYIEDKKIGLIKVQQNNQNLLPVPVPTKNQLLIVVIERIMEGQQSSKIHKFYRDEKDTVFVVFKSQITKSQYEFYLNKHTSTEELRTLIYETIKDQQVCQSQHNIIFKYKIKKNSKHNIQALNTSKLLELIRVDKCIYYSISNLKVEQRVHRKQLNFYCREQNNAKLSQVIQIIIEKTQNQEKILQQIFQNIQKLKIFQKKQGFKLRTFLLGKDRCFINDLVDQKGYIQSKGQLLTILQREKNSILVVEQYKAADIDIKSENVVNILVHHLTKTSERLGNPRWLQVSRKVKMSKLKYLIIEQIENDILQFQGKFYNVNPLKARLLSYVKDLSKSIQLPQPEELSQIFQEQCINVDEQSKQGIQVVQIQQQSKKVTIQDNFSRNKIVRVAVIHNFITKGSQLKLHVQ